jgi:hypothetical protein
MALCTTVSFAQRSRASLTQAVSPSLTLPIRSANPTLTSNLTKHSNACRSSVTLEAPGIGIEKTLALDPAEPTPKRVKSSTSGLPIDFTLALIPAGHLERFCGKVPGNKRFSMSAG